MASDGLTSKYPLTNQKFKKSLTRVHASGFCPKNLIEQFDSDNIFRDRTKAAGCSPLTRMSI